MTPSDLTAYARIRTAALDLFATRGVARTTIRDVAREAGVSPGLVQHHFRTKAGLRDAVNEHVVALATEALGELPDPSGVDNPFRDLADRITAVASEHPTALLHVARSVSDGDPAGLELFGGFVAIARTQLRELQKVHAVDRRHDLDWAALHLVVFNLGTLLFRPAVERALGEPFFTEEAIRRWNDATTELLVDGLAPRTGRRPSSRGRASSRRPSSRRGV